MSTSTIPNTSTISSISSTLVVPHDRNGPPGMANGGWLVGRLAEELGGRDVTVTLRAPTPLETPVDLVGEGDAARVFAGDTLLAEVAPAEGPPTLPPIAVTADIAVIAETRFAGHHEHPFPTCFVCGTDRDPGDGLRIFAGPVPGRPGTVAALWTPPATLGDDDGNVPTSVVAAALDCPTGWAHWSPGAVALLGRLTLHHTGDVLVGADHVVVAEQRGSQGRKAFSGAAVFDTTGRCVATSSAVWLRLG
jgi:hypothetical protein